MGIGIETEPAQAVAHSQEALDVFAAFTTPPTAARKNLINACIASLKTNGVWPVFDCLYVMAAADAQAASINWKKPSAFKLTQTNAPVFTADRGFNGNGTTSFNASGFNPVTAGGNFSQNSAHIASWGVTATADSVMGAGSVVLVLNGVTNMTVKINAASGVIVANTNSTQDILAQRTDAANIEAYRNGALTVTPTANASTVMTSETFSVGGRGPAGSSLQQVAVQSWGGKLTAAQVLARYNALNTYLVAVGAA